MQVHTYIIRVLGFLMIISLGRDLSGQVISFNQGNVHLKKTSHFAMPNSSEKSKSGLVQRFVQCYNEDTYEVYEDCFLAEECHVSLETFVDWKDKMHHYDVHISAEYYFELNGQEYGVIQYLMSYNDKSYYVPQAFKLVAGEWYYCELQENLDLINVNTFFSLMTPQLMDQLNKALENRNAEVNHYIAGDGSFNGQILMENLMNRYQSESEHFSFINGYLYKPIISETTISSIELESVKRYLNTKTQSQIDQDYLFRLYQDYQLSEIAKRLGEITGEDPMILYQDITGLKKFDKNGN